MKKITNLLFVMLLLLCSCSKDDDSTDDNTGDNPEATIPSLTGAITKDGVNFDNPKLKCTDCIIEFQPATRLMADERKASMKLLFNDNVEIIFNSIADIRDKTEADKVYRLLKNCVKSEVIEASITVSLKNGDKIVSSETFDAPANSDWWEMASDNSYFTIDLTLKGKRYTYKGMFKYVFPEEEPETTGAITDKGVDFNNTNLKCIGYSFNMLPYNKTNLVLQFNDAVEIIIKGTYDSLDKTDADRIYRVLKNCETITINLKVGTKIVSSETFDNPDRDGNWWKMADKDAYFTIDLNLKGKQYTYKGQVKYVF